MQFYPLNIRHMISDNKKGKMVDLAVAFFVRRTVNQVKRASAPEERAKCRQAVEGLSVALRAVGRETQRDCRHMQGEFRYGVTAFKKGSVVYCERCNPLSKD